MLAPSVEVLGSISPLSPDSKFTPGVLLIATRALHAEGGSPL
jgi:hypothetical protein